MLIEAVIGAALAQPKPTLFLDLCGAQETPACSTYLLGFMNAMSATRTGCFPKHPGYVDVSAVRRATLKAVSDKPSERQGSVLLDAIAKMYPCKGKE